MSLEGTYLKVIANLLVQYSISAFWSAMMGTSPASYPSVRDSCFLQQCFPLDGGSKPYFNCVSQKKVFPPFKPFRWYIVVIKIQNNERTEEIESLPFRNVSQVPLGSFVAFLKSPPTINFVWHLIKDFSKDGLISEARWHEILLCLSWVSSMLTSGEKQPSYK